MGLSRLHTTLALGSMLTPALALAGSFDLQTTLGNSLFSQRFAYDSRANSTLERGLVGDGAFVYSNIVYNFPRLGLEVNDRSYSGSGSLGWRFSKKFEAGLLMNLSSTPVENLESWGGGAYFEFTHTFGESGGTTSKPDRTVGAQDDAFPADFLADEVEHRSPESSASLFRPSISFRLSLGRTNMTDRPADLLVQIFPRLASLVQGLNQRYLTLELAGSPWRWFSARLSVTGYSYEQDVNTFISILGDRRTLAASSFEASLNGLPQNASALTLYFYPSDDWEIAWTGNSARSYSTGSIGRGTQLTVSHDFNSWLRAGIGLERDVSDEVAQSLTLLNFSFAL